MDKSVVLPGFEELDKPIEDLTLAERASQLEEIHGSMKDVSTKWENDIDLSEVSDSNLKQFAQNGLECF